MFDPLFPNVGGDVTTAKFGGGELMDVTDEETEETLEILDETEEDGVLHLL